MVKCVTNELAIVEDEMKLDGVLVLELGCLHLQKKQKKIIIILHFSALDPELYVSIGYGREKKLKAFLSGT